MCGTTIVKMVVAGRGTYVCESCQPRRGGSGSEQLVQAPALGGGLHLVEAADQLAVDDDLGEAHHPGLARQLRAAGGVLGEVDLGELDPAALSSPLTRAQNEHGSVV